MKHWLALLCCAWMAGCATVAPLPPPAPLALLADSAFQPPQEPVSADGLFDLSPAMQRYLQAEGKPPRSQPDPRRHLVDMLYRKHKLALEYDAAQTRTAAQAFEARSGNCLSLVIMTAAFAKAMGLPVHYQTVIVDDSWSRSGDLVVASSHVNLALDSPPLRQGWERSSDTTLVVDFLPGSELRDRRYRALAEQTVVAMYLNNRAAENLAAGRVDDAYWWARGAVLQDPAFLAAYNTLGVIYLRRGLPAQAQSLFDELLLREPDNTKAMANLVHALQRQGRQAEAAQLAERLAQIEPYPPFHFFDAGLRALRNRDPAQARDLFRRELRRAAHQHEIHHALAQALLALGEVAQAHQHLELARQYSPTQKDQSRYAAKLDRLRAQRLQ